MFDRGTIRLVKIAGIPVRIHWSFAFIFFWVGYNAWKDHLSFTGFLHMQMYVLILFACVVMHEYGHALMARRFGNTTQDILLTPIGGIARLNGISEKPIQEFWIAIAGPLVNVAIVAMISIGLLITGRFNFDQLMRGGSNESFLADLFPLLMLSNIVLAVFNLIPAFPMDGGRILRALLAMKWSRMQATLIAARIGQSIAALGFLFAVSQAQWMLCLVSTFIFFTAGSELKQVEWETALQDKTAEDLANTDFGILQSDETMAHVMDQAAKGIEKNYLVFHDQMLIGYLSHQAVIHAIKNKLSAYPISSLTKRDFQTLEGSEPLKGIFQLMQAGGVPIMPVIRDGRILGIIEETQLKRYIDMNLQSK